MNTASAAESMRLTATCSSSLVYVLHSYVLPIYTSRPYMTKQSYCTNKHSLPDLLHETVITNSNRFLKIWLFYFKFMLQKDFWHYQQSYFFFLSCLIIFSSFFLTSSCSLALIFPLVHCPVILNPCWLLCIALDNLPADIQ